MAENSAGSLIFTIAADASGMLEATRKVESSSLSMEKSLDKVSAAAEDASSALDDISSSASNAKSSISDASNSIAKSSSSISKSIDEVAASAEKTTRIVSTSSTSSSKSLDSTSSSAARASSAFGSLGGEADKAAPKISAAELALSQFGSMSGQAASKMSELSSSIVRTSSDINQSITRAKQPLGSLGGEIDKVSKPVEDVGVKFTGMGSLAGGAATSISTASNKISSSLVDVSESSRAAWSSFGSLGNAPQLQITKTSAAVSRMIEMLKLEAATSKLNANEKMLYIAALKGATAAELQEIASLQKLAGVANSSTTNFRGMRGAAGQLGYQIQDIAVQLQMGTNAMMVFGQQGSQIASIFGPGGAVIGAIIAIAFAIGSTLVSAIRGANSEFDVMTAKVNELGKAQKQVAIDEIKTKLDDVNKKIKDFAGGVDAAGVAGSGWSKTISFNSEGLHKQQAYLEDLNQEQKKYNDRLKELAGGGTKQLTDANDDWRLSVQAGTIALQDGERKAAIFIRTQETLRKAKDAGLSPEVTQAQIKADTDLINKQFDAQEAHDARAKAQQAATSVGKKDLSSQAQVSRQLEDSASKAAQLGIEYNNLKKGIDDNSAATSRFTIESATLEAQRQLGAAATKEQIEAQAANILKIHEETAAIDKLKKKQAEDVQITQKFETVESKTGTKGENVDAQYKEDLKALENYHKMAGASDARYQKTKSKLEEKYRKDKQAAAIEDYKAQSEWNAFLMDGLDALGQSATTTIAGLASGTMTATEAMQNFANIILNQAVGALVSMGIEALKNQIVGQTAAAASVMAAEGTAAAITSAYAPAAFMANTATMGGASATGLESLQAGVVAAKALGVAGGRQFGGGTNAGSVYRLGENNTPEVWKTSAGMFGVAGDGGNVTPLKDLGSGGGFSQQVNITNTAGASVTTNTSADGKRLNIAIDQRVSKAISEKRGRIYSAFNRTTNLQSRAR